MNNQRFLSLDVFRGMTVCFMIIVNSPGSWGNVYPMLLHASWHGFTVTDLVFPSFLFAVGNALAFVKKQNNPVDHTSFWKKTLKRFVIIFITGILLNAFPFFDFSTGHFIALDGLRIMGVLQRIALCYLFAVVVVQYTSNNIMLIVSGVLLMGYWLLLYGLGGSPDPYNITGYAGNAIDYWVLGKNHLYTGEGMPFDPEGLLSTLPAIVNVLAGYWAGDFIRRKGTTMASIRTLLLTASGFILAGLVWHGVFPINKKIWTSSFVMLTVGLDLLLLTVLIAIIEMKNITRWSYFFVVFGRNPLSIYILSNVLLVLLYSIPANSDSLQVQFYEHLCQITTAKNASLLFALLFMLLCWLIGLWMDRKKIYIRV